MKINKTARIAFLSGGAALLIIGALALTYDILIDGTMHTTDTILIIGAGVAVLLMGGYARIVQAQIDKINIPHYEGNNGHHKGIQHAYMDSLHIIGMRSQLMAEYDITNPDELKNVKAPNASKE
jgi:hypothetical protein